MPDDSEQASGKVDGVAVLYIVGGIPAIVGFIVVLFLLTNLFTESIPA